MAAGVTHRHITALATPVVALVVGAASGDLGLALAAGAGCYAGMFIHPDWDQNHSAPWWRKPYALLIKHRSPLSHWPVVGTLGRLLYLTLPLIVALLAGGYALGWPGAPDWLNWRDLAPGAAATAGLMVSDALHWLLDWPLWRLFRPTHRRFR